MAMVFPTSPTVGQVFTSGGRSWVWNGSAWDSPSATNVLQVPYGLELVKAQAIGTSVASVSISDIFSSKYDNYKIIINGGTCQTLGPLHLQLGATTSGYRYSIIFNQTSAATPTGLAGENAIYFSDFGRGAGTNGFNGNCDLFSPNETKPTGIRYSSFDPASTGGYNITGQGVMPNTTQYTGVSIISGAGFMTGGTVYVYGYRKA
jgi:hypothetical protein